MFDNLKLNCVVLFLVVTRIVGSKKPCALGWGVIIYVGDVFTRLHFLFLRHFLRWTRCALSDGKHEKKSTCTSSSVDFFFIFLYTSWTDVVHLLSI